MSTIEQLAKSEREIDCENFTKEKEEEFEKLFQKLEGDLMDEDEVTDTLDESGVKNPLHALRLLYSNNFNKIQKACYLDVVDSLISYMKRRKL
jgi:hypothetical protein